MINEPKERVKKLQVKVKAMIQDEECKQFLNTVEKLKLKWG